MSVGLRSSIRFASLLAVLVAERELFERIEHVSLHLYADQVEMEQLRGADLALPSLERRVWP